MLGAERPLRLQEAVAWLVRQIRQRGATVGSGAVAEALQALEQVDLGDPLDVICTLRAVLAADPEEVAMIDELMPRLFDALLGQPRPAAGATPAATNPRVALPELGRADETTPAAPWMIARDGVAEPDALGEQDDAMTVTAVASARHGTTGGQESVSEQDFESMLAAARALVRRVRIVAQRRWRAAAKGSRLDFRGTLRRSIVYGEVGAKPRWLRRTAVPPRFVLLLDASRSMHAALPRLLQFAYALMRTATRTEVMLFSTTLRRVTGDLRQASAGDLPRLENLGTEFGGGTRIGASLQTFLRGHQSLLGPGTVVLIASDGLETGDYEALRRAMREVKRRSLGVIWLNPLISSPGYRPEARGMRLALPYVDTFFDAGRLAGLPAHLSFGRRR